MHEGYPPLCVLVHSIERIRGYAVRKGSVRSTHKSCYIVRRRHILRLKDAIFTKKQTNVKNKDEKQKLNLQHYNNRCFLKCANFTKIQWMNTEKNVFYRLRRRM